MAGFETDTSFYPKALPVTPMGVAGQLGTMANQAADFDQKKLSQANEALTYLTRAMTAIGPDGTKEQYARAGQDAVNAGLVPANTLQIWNQKLADAKSPRDFFNEAMTAVAQHKEVIDYHIGPVRHDDTGQGTLATRTPSKPGGQTEAISFTPRRLQPNQPTIDPNTGQPQLYGNEPQPQLPINLNQRPSISQPLPVGSMNPAAVPGMRPGERTVSAEVLPVQQPSGPATGMSPGFEEGLKQRTEDQNLATTKLTGLKPLMLAYPKMLQLQSSGPGTDAWNQAVAFLKANNIIPTGVNSQTEIYQEVNKYLNQYVTRGGSRSDSDLAAKELSNPNLTKQILPALLELTRKTAGQDRIEAARPNAFTRTATDKDGKESIIPNSNFSEYGAHRSSFPQNMDVEAAHIDFLKPKERNAKIDEMWAAAKKGNQRAIRFIKTLNEMKRQNYYDTSMVPE